MTQGVKTECSSRFWDMQHGLSCVRCEDVQLECLNPFCDVFRCCFTSSCSQCCCKSSSCHPVGGEMKAKLYQWQSLKIKRTVVQKKKSTPQQFRLIFSEWLYSRRVGSAPIWLIRFCLRRNQLIKVGTLSDLNSLPRHSWAGLNLPLTIPICMQVESLGDLAGWWRCGQILLIGKDEHWNAF